jgi:hypothetical protein
MPPEQMGGTVDASCDIYALGATLLHALTGKPPEEMTSDGFSLDADKHLRQVEDPLLRRVIKKMVAPSRADRFRSAGEVLQAMWGRHHALGAQLRSLAAQVRALPVRTRRLFAALGAVAALGAADLLVDPAAFLGPHVPAPGERSDRRRIRMDQPWWAISMQIGPQGPVPAGMAGLRVVASPMDATLTLDDHPLQLWQVARDAPMPIPPGPHQVKFIKNGVMNAGAFYVRAGDVALVQGLLMSPRYPPGKDPWFPGATR